MSSSVTLHLAHALRDAIRNAFAHEVQPDAIKFTKPPSPEMGDFAFACFSLASALKQKPADIASRVAALIECDEVIVSASAAGPYLNLTLDSEARGETIRSLTSQFETRSVQESGTTVIEYFHANTHKAVHIGHVRNIVLGEAIARLLEWEGKKVVRVNYQGDIGLHVAKCLWGFLRLCGGGEGSPRTMTDVGIPEELQMLASSVRCRRAGEGQAAWLSRVYAAAHHASEHSKEVAQEIQDINKKLYEGDENLREVWSLTRKWCLDDFEKLYDLFGVSFDRLYFESEVEKRGITLVKELVKKNIAKESQGALIMDLEEDNLGILVLVTGIETALYGAKELALAELKIKEYGDAVKSLHLVAEEQSLYFQQIFETFRRMQSPLADKSEHIVYGLVRLASGKMSSREGTVILYENLLYELLELARHETKNRHEEWGTDEIEAVAHKIALAALKFEMLKVDARKGIMFDAKRAIDLQGDTGPYLLYTVARINSLLGKVPPEKRADKISWSHLNTPEERTLQALLMQTMDVCAEAAHAYRPGALIHHLLGLAKQFNSFYHEHRVLEAETEGLKNARLLLTQLVERQLRRGLGLLGIDTIEEM